VIDPSTIVDGHATEGDSHATEGDSHATLIVGRETRRKTATLRLFARHPGAGRDPVLSVSTKTER
jgi:hypothetical protein